MENFGQQCYTFTNPYLKSKSFVCCLRQREIQTNDKDSVYRKELDLAIESRMLARPLCTKLIQVPGITKTTYLMEFSPDNKTVASIHGNHYIYLTDLKTGKHIKALGEHPRTPWSLAFHPLRSNLLASGCLGGQVRIWFTNEEKNILWNVPKRTVIASLAFHPLQSLLAIATDNEIYFWDWNELEPTVFVSRSNSEKIRYVAFDNVGKSIIIGIGADTKYTEWSSSSQPLLLEDRAPIRENEIDRVEMSSNISDSDCCGKGSRKYRIEIWDFSDINDLNIWNPEDKNIVVKDCNIHNDASIDISSDGKLLAAFSSIGYNYANSILRVYSLEKSTRGRILHSLKVDPSAVSISFSPTRHYILVGLGGQIREDDSPIAFVYRLLDTDENPQPNNVNVKRIFIQRMGYVRSILHNVRESGISVALTLNCIRWVPLPGEGMLYATSTGHLCVIR